MKVSTEQREPREAVLTVELDNADVEPYLDQAYRQAVRRLSIPGFRKGKAPRRIVEQMFGRGYLLNEALDTVIQEFTSKAVQEEGLDIGGIPSVSLDGFDPPQFTATVPLQPLVDLGNLDSVRHPKEDVELPEDRVDATLEQMRMELAVWEPAEDAVQMDDLINLTIEGWVEDEDGTRREIVHSEDTDYIPRPNSTFPVPGLDEGLVGLPVGEQSTFDVEVPEDATNAEAAGKTAHFEATVHSIKRRSLPELDDEFAKSVGDDYESIEALRDKVRENLLEREKRLAEIRHQDETLAKVTEEASVAISPLIIEHEVEHYVHGREDDIKAGRVGFEEYREYLSWQGMSDEEVHEQARPKVEERLKRAHVIRAVAQREGFEATDEDVAEEIDRLLADSGEMAEEHRKQLDDPDSRESIRRMLVQRRTLEYLSNLALRDAPGAAKPKARAAASKSGGAKPRQTKTPARQTRARRQQGGAKDA
ncbi:MAG: trigger factor [Chloroflexota bacterium]|nr:trigger factor [Chloroflexota bacterium]MDE2886501.1 trigger factor [Chloroflexota bacterium]